MTTLALTTGKRKIKDGSRYNAYFPPESAAYGSSTVLNKNGTVENTVKYIADIIEKDKSDTAKIAKILKGKNLKETITNIHSFMVNYLQYDTEAGEKLRSPRRTWWVGHKQNDKETGDNGVDCDDLTIFAGSILRNLGIPFNIRIVKINKDDFQHVYLIVPKNGKGLSGPYYTLDGVISDFDYEYPFKTEKTFDMQGMKIEYLGNITGENADDKVLSMLKNYRYGIANGHLVTTKINHADVLKMLDYAIANWHDVAKRKQAVDILAASEKQNFPGKHFFAVLQNYVDGNLSGVLGQLGDDATPPAPKSNKTKKSNVWDAISALFGAAANFDWGLIGGKKNNQTTAPNIIPPAAYNSPERQAAGISMTSVAGILIGGALVYFAYENFKKAKPKAIASRARTKKTPVRKTQLK